MVNGTQLTCLMNYVPTVLMAALASTAATYAFQRLITNRKGGELLVTKSLDQMADGIWTFVAMQYYFGILNRTYLLLVTESLVCGAKVKGVLSAPRAPDARWKDPLFYVSPDLANKYASMDVGSNEFLTCCRANFRIAKLEIRDVEFSQTPKWGMATVPYSGRIFLRMKSGKSIELILLGDQDGIRIRERLQATTKEQG
jgi:hypothetical protein